MLHFSRKQTLCNSNKIINTFQDALFIPQLYYVTISVLLTTRDCNPGIPNPGRFHQSWIPGLATS